MAKTKQTSGVLIAALAYVMWGILPLYWKLLQEASAMEILAHRIVWSLLLTLVLIKLMKRTKEVRSLITEMKNDKRLLLSVFISGVLISCNWFIYIFAVNTGHVLETSLGYYINPLMTVLLGIIVLKERLTSLQIISFIIAGTGVLILTIQYGRIPWLALGLAISFALYGLAKKTTKLKPIMGLTFETMLITPLAVFYLVYQTVNQNIAFGTESFSLSLLLIGAGVATAMPLLFFAEGAKQIPMSMLGFLQYIAPTMTLFLGIFIFHEAFSVMDFVAFALIWIALAIYTVSNIRERHLIKIKKEKAIKYS